MFQYRADVPDTINMVGAPIDPLTTDIPMVAGWNWIGYLPQSPLMLDEALASLNPIEGDLVKNQTSFAQFIPGFGWLGNLHFMQAPEGYALKISNAGTLTYPEGFTGNPVENRTVTEGPRTPWSVNPADFEHNMVLVGMLSENDVNITNGEMTLGVFANGKSEGKPRLPMLNHWANGCFT